MAGKIIVSILFFMVFNICIFAQSKFETIYQYCSNVTELIKSNNTDPSCEGEQVILMALAEERAIMKHKIDSAVNILKRLPINTGDTIYYINVIEYWNNKKFGRQYIINPEYRFYSVKCEIKEISIKGLALNPDSIYVKPIQIYE